MALTTEDRVLVHKRRSKMRGVHGGMTKAEVEIPLVIVGDPEPAAVPRARL